MNSLKASAKTSRDIHKNTPGDSSVISVYSGASWRDNFSEGWMHLFLQYSQNMLEFLNFPNVLGGHP